VSILDLILLLIFVLSCAICVWIDGRRVDAFRARLDCQSMRISEQDSIIAEQSSLLMKLLSKVERLEKK
jgi:hypothetical protein